MARRQARGLVSRDHTFMSGVGGSTGRRGALAGLGTLVGMSGGVGGRSGSSSSGGPAQAAWGAPAFPSNDEIGAALRDTKWPADFPFPPSSFERFDESQDTLFYDQPRFVTHIDDGAIGALTQWYAENLPPSDSGAAVLDLCSSWISHFPAGYSNPMVVGLGMNADELARNRALTGYDVVDLNASPKLPYPDETFDAVVNAVSVDYLTRPLEVFAEIARVLKPGGLAAMSFSNRYFPTKVISLWTQTADLDHCVIAASYFVYTPADSVPGSAFTPPEARNITAKRGRGAHDPMYVVYARKKA